MAIVGRLLSHPVDVQWLPGLVVLGFFAKLIGSALRYYYVHIVYASGDAYGYYRTGMEYAALWRAGINPGLSGARGEGTQFMEAISGLVLTPFMPDFLGAFFIFGALSYFGQLAFYAAFRRWAEPHQLKPFALLIFFLPSYVFWPSSIGKDAVMLLGLGLATYFMVRALEGFAIRWLLAMAAVLAGVGLVRIHIVALFAGALFFTALIARPNMRPPGFALRRLLVVGLVAASGVVAIGAFQDRFGTDLLNTSDVEAFGDDVADRTSRGSVVEGGPVRSPADIPDAMVLVLFRPFVWEADNSEVLMSALETSFVLGLVIWKLPAMLRNRHRWRANALVVFSTFYVFAFSVAFSAIRNLGIIARQRTQVLAFLLIVVVALGFEAPRPRRRRAVRQTEGGTPDQAALEVAANSSS
jgi:hypothetical protein